MAGNSAIPDEADSSGEARQEAGNGEELPKGHQGVRHAGHRRRDGHYCKKIVAAGLCNNVSDVGSVCLLILPVRPVPLRQTDTARPVSLYCAFNFSTNNETIDRCNQLAAQVIPRASEEASTFAATASVVERPA